MRPCPPRTATTPPAPPSPTCGPPSPGGPDDARAAGLVRRLRARSAEFAALWEAHDVAVRRRDVKRFVHPVVGLLELDCEVLLNPEHDQRLVVYTARPGSESYERLELLRVVGLQRLADPR